jgi:hypothetical protein
MSETAEGRLKQLRASPIYPLVTQFCAAPFKLAPELEMVLERILRIKAVRIVPTTTKSGMVFNADPSDGSITAGIRSHGEVVGFLLEIRSHAARKGTRRRRSEHQPIGGDEAIPLLGAQVGD